MSAVELISKNLASKIVNSRQANPKRFYFEVKAADVRETVEYLFNGLNLRFVTVSGVDMREGIEMMYHLSDDSTGTVVTMRAMISDKKNPRIDSIAKIIIGAAWIEREIHELLGVDFAGNDNLKHLLLPEDWPKNNYPLRHDNE
ncbi:MAG TPA: hypothetical protein DEE98_03145 [Elusimicrobia bacterium]|nr:MAG: hypothetical protein A2278_07965 [Elusimicrobia bacterium RIFOXYA12_FULL_49_49]OGS10189.1 MAG: hypothetical protein A2204_04285 [Elusimicrobia bacterium RIFOXYA1_FULL_47_7]OGS11811.1 MAG: hypothetical protein A2386_02235 [Elusimicrobia bacterium RIFOXYB1_FULL_48_9]OGS16001.1 MAG: hypothetical protein A2251_02300 [Elusimicrobia bacterium RIFOXYA2_FULL_47_53]OGS26319.1 MAG: hypothetical protein A2339_02965 [Elusimicrobia bacterium RIFOXYB12_FULL_50_12]OGS29169.1 MAG: hypothetical protein